MATDTELKIRTAARKLFQQKGYAAATTREIAAEAGVNLALLNYYFKSKEMLFGEIMMETLGQMKQMAQQVLNNDKLGFEENLHRQIAFFTHFLLEHKDLPMFVLGELHKHPKYIVELVNPHNLVAGSVFERQMKEFAGDPDLDVADIMVNGMSMLLFPVLASEMVKNLFGLDEEGLNRLILHRCDLIPQWIVNMIKK